MSASKGRRSASSTETGTTPAAVLARLQRIGTRKQVSELARYGITAHKPYGVTVGELRKYAKSIGTDHELALALWDSRRYEARMLAAMVDDPARVTLRQMDTWSSEFDNWAITDTVCFQLFDRSRYAWRKVDEWARSKPEFRKRAAFALMWSLSVHDKDAADDLFLDRLHHIADGAQDDRQYVKKGVNMALRAIGKRNRTLNDASIEMAARLAASNAAAPRWVGSHALRELQSAAVQSRLRKRK